MRIVPSVLRLQQLVFLGCVGLSVAATACDPGQREPDSGLPGDAVGADTTIGEDLASFLARNRIVPLARLADGTELGETMTGPDGVARFYSAVHETYFEMPVLGDGEVALPGKRVQLSVGTAAAAYLVSDPEGAYAPLLYTFDLPQENSAFDVDGYAEYVRAAGLEDYVPSRDGNPFGTSRGPLVASSTEPLVVGISVSISIRSVLTSLAVTAAASVFRNLVETSCRFVAPTFVERCQLLGNIVGTLTGLVGGIATGANGWALGATLLDGALSTAGYNCDRLGGYLVGYVRGATDTRARDRYRDVARRFNFLLHRMETDPRPEQPTWEQAQRMALDLIAVRDVVRNGYFQVWNTNAASSGFGLEVAKTATSSFFNSLSLRVQETVLTRISVQEYIRWYLQVGPREASFSVQSLRYVQTEWRTFTFPVDFSQRQQALNGLILGCAFHIVDSATLEWQAAGRRQEQIVQVAEIVDAMLDVFEAGLDAIYADVWGDTIPPAGCLADEYEPNHSWRLAVASPLPVTLGSSDIAELRGLSFCDGTGTSGADEDWYAYYTGPIELRVQARVLRADGGRGQDQEVCLDVYFYSEIYTVFDDEPTWITSTCGRVDAQPATSTFGVRRTLGESWSMLLLRVRPGPSATGVPIDYGLRFTP